MKRTGLVAMGLVLAICGLTWAIPSAAIDPAGPGLYCTYSGSSVWQTDGWGVVVGGGSFDLIPGGGKAYIDADGGYVRYNTTGPSYGEQAPMSNTLDWVFSVEWTKTPGIHSTIFELSGGTSTPYGNGDIARLTGDSGTTLTLYGGDGTGNYITVGTIYNVVNSTYLLTLHYKASSQKFDFYLDNTLVSSDFAPRNAGWENLIFVQLGGSGSTHRDIYDNLKVGLLGPDIVANATIRCAVSLGGYTGDNASVGVTAQLKQGTTLVKEVGPVFLAADGTFDVPGIMPGDYTLSVKSYAHLKNATPVSVTNANPTLASISLVGGNADGDTSISSSDLAIVLTNMDLTDQ